MSTTYNNYNPKDLGSIDSQMNTAISNLQTPTVSTSQITWIKENTFEIDKELKDTNLTTVSKDTNTISATTASDISKFIDSTPDWTSSTVSFLIDKTNSIKNWKATTGEQTNSTISDITSWIGDEAASTLSTAWTWTKTVAVDFYNNLLSSPFSSLADAVSNSSKSTGLNYVGNVVSAGITSLATGINTELSSLLGMIDGGSTSSLGQLTTNVVTAITSAAVNYVDGVSELPFGSKMEQSWYGTENSFLNSFVLSSNTSDYTISVLPYTPLDSADSSSLYGNMILGCPYMFTSITDPSNRAMLNTFIKDSKILSLTPGLPKYNGSEYSLNQASNSSDSILSQTTTAKEMVAWLTKNGMDQAFSEKDKRYYTFKEDYKDYYAYLEALLNPIWLKLGLGSNDTDSKNFNIFSFFNIGATESASGTDTKNRNSLKPEYNSSLGFVIDINGAASESIDNSSNSIGEELADKTNGQSVAAQKLNYITGMGTGGSFLNSSRLIGNIYNTNDILSENVMSPLSAGLSKGGKGVKKLAQSLKNVVTLANNVAKFTATEDIGSIVQSFTAYNGMKVLYPNLWGESQYHKNVSFNFNFISPYGDPLSIFQYVYVPFMALLAFCMPRQAASNGLVSPFFVRADVPGLFTSDLAMISGVNWIKGGDSNLWTKDGLPRAISGQITIEDMYPYLSMTKRFSYLSANPSLTVWLDNMAGLHTIINSSDNDPLNKYWANMINRVNGSSSVGGGNVSSKVNNTLWNVYGTAKRNANKSFLTTSTRLSASNDIDAKDMPWLTDNTK